MSQHPHSGRLIGLTIVLSIALALLGYRLADLQVMRHDQLQTVAERNTHREFDRAALRGKILDIRGNPLAISVPVKRVCADPSLVGNRQTEVARVIAPLLQTNESYVIERLTPKITQVDGKIVTNHYTVLKRKVPLDVWEKVNAAMTNLTFAGIDESKLKPSERLFYSSLRRKAVFPEDEQIRLYPNQSLAAHVVGFVGGDDQKGLNGIEMAFDNQLTGIRGWRRTEMDGKNREMVVYREQDVPPRDGLNVVLSLDAGLQNIVEEELSEAMPKHTPKSISCTVVRPKTGEILAMATVPTFNPNEPGAAPVDALRNRVITDVSEPGSTFKIVVVSGALNEGMVTLNDNFFCENGHFAYAGKQLHDHEPYGMLTVERIITKSSNIGAAKIAIQHLHEDKLYNYIRDFGFGKRTGIALPGEVSGIFHPTNKWSKVSIAQIPMGQGIAVTPLQTLMAMCTIANGGKLMHPMVVNRIEDPDGNVVARNQPEMERQVISESAAREMVKALKTVVGDDGTAPKARLENYTVAGKTGTAQKAENGHYAPGKYFASFIGFFPADNPELCISVVMDEPKNGHYGGLTAAPVFKAIAERAARYLNLKPDIQPELTIEDTGTNAVSKTQKRKSELKGAELASLKKVK